jgi:hypothetical protein
MARRFRFNPDKVAYYEKAGWEAYYDRKWLRAFGLMVRLNREQFGMSWPSAISAAIDIVRASRAFAPVENDIPTAQGFLAQFFNKARQSVELHADAQTLAALEMDYWVVHRKLAVERQQNPQADNLEPLVQSLANLHSGLFGHSPQVLRSSAEWRAKAAEAVDRITGKRSTNVAADWREVEHCLQQAYRAVQTVSH